jgi:hypothetical protein
MSFSIEKLRSSLDNMGFIAEAGVSSELLMEIFDRSGIKMPSILEKLYLGSDGSSAPFGPFIWKFWKVNPKMITLADYWGHTHCYNVKDNGRAIDPEKYIIFLDCLIDLPIYAFCGDHESKYFGEVIGCIQNSSEIDVFVAGLSMESFLEEFTESEGEEMLIYPK